MMAKVEFVGDGVESFRAHSQITAFALAVKRRQGYRGKSRVAAEVKAQSGQLQVKVYVFHEDAELPDCLDALSLPIDGFSEAAFNKVRADFRNRESGPQEKPIGAFEAAPPESGTNLEFPVAPHPGELCRKGADQEETHAPHAGTPPEFIGANHLTGDLATSRFEEEKLRRATPDPILCLLHFGYPVDSRLTLEQIETIAAGKFSKFSGERLCGVVSTTLQFGRLLVAFAAITDTGLEHLPRSVSLPKRGMRQDYFEQELVSQGISKEKVNCRRVVLVDESQAAN